MRLEWSAVYYDGKTAKENRVILELTTDSIIVKRTEPLPIAWKYGEISKFSGDYDGEPVRLFRGDEQVVVTEKDFLNALRHAAKGHSSRFQDPDSGKKRIVWVPLAAVMAIAAVLIAYYLVIPYSAGFMAAYIPASWEEKLGEAVLDEFIKDMPECNVRMSAPIETIFKKLNASAQPHPYKFKVHIVENRAVNAFALPGGHIVVFSGLLNLTERPEEIAGVLAHEMEHVLMRHATKGILQNFSTKMLFSAATGSLGSAGSTLDVLGSLRYSRLNEKEADLKGLDLVMKSNINPAGMIDLFYKMKEKYGKMPEVSTYLLTHPLPDDRIEYLYKNMKPYNGPALLPDLDWNAYKCSCKASSKDEKKQEEDADGEPQD